MSFPGPFFALSSSLCLFIHTFLSFHFVGSFSLFSFLFSPFRLSSSVFSPRRFYARFPVAFLPAFLPAPFSLSLPGFTLLRFPSRSSPLSDFPAVPPSPHPCPLSPPFSHLFSPVSSPFPFLPAARLLSFPTLPFFPLPFSHPSLFPSFPLRFTHPFPPRPFSALSPSTPSSLLLSAPRPLLSPLRFTPHFSPPFALLAFFRPLPPLSLFPARPVDRARLLCYNTFR